MVKRRVRRKEFECGHKGLGMYCHSCYQLERVEYGRVEKAENDNRSESPSRSENFYRAFDFRENWAEKSRFPYRDEIGTT